MSHQLQQAGRRLWRPAPQTVSICVSRAESCSANIAALRIVRQRNITICASRVGEIRSAQLLQRLAKSNTLSPHTLGQKPWAKSGREVRKVALASSASVAWGESGGSPRATGGFFRRNCLRVSNPLGSLPRSDFVPQKALGS